MVRRATLERDWTKGSIVRNLLSLSLPIIMTQTLNQVGQFVDMIWVGRLGAVSMAGVGISSLIIMMVNLVNTGLFVGLRAMVARHIGAGDVKGANHVAQQAFVIAAVFAVFIAAIGIFFAEPIFVLLGVEPEVVTQGAAYMRIQFVGLVTLSLLHIAQTMMQASGDTVTPMWIAVFFRILHVVLDPFLIFGWWIFPQLGVTGAALTQVIAQGVGGAIGLGLLFSGRTRLRLTLNEFHLDRNVIWRLVKVGTPAAITGVQRSLPYVVLIWFITPFGYVAVAAHSLVQRIIDSFVQMPGVGMGDGSGVIGGHNLGAGRPERAERTGWTAVGLTTGLMIIVSVVVWFWAEHIVRLFNSEPDLVTIASAFLRIQIIGYMLFGFVMVLSHTLEGIGDTMPVMLATLISMWVLQVPLGYFLPKFTSLGVYGVRWAIVAALVMRAVAFFVYFKSGRWKRKIV
ncbi:MAG: MATE family efflux transporter [Chloroflexi bacterium]|nr:MATE family efflux transporter [Chloroflexota bacterium]